MALQILKRFEEEPRQWNLYPEGEADISTAPVFRAALDEAYQAEKGNITLHMDALGYLDSTGLGVIIGAYDRMKENGHRIVLSNPPENIKKLLRITNLDKLLCPEMNEK